MRTLDSHPLMQQSYDLIQTIEGLGASPALTAAVVEAAKLKQSISDHLDALEGQPPAKEG